MNGWQDMDRFLGSMDLLRKRMNRIYNDLDRAGWRVAENTGGYYPPTNLYEVANHFEMQAELPGFGKDDLNIKLQGNYLELSGEKNNETPAGHTAQRLERQGAAFSRSFTLPVDIDQEKVEATLKDGILTLILPKAEAARPRQIVVK
jgi:HSP20 family protein